MNCHGDTLNWKTKPYLRVERQMQPPRHPYESSTSCYHNTGIIPYTTQVLVVYCIRHRYYTVYNTGIIPYTTQVLYRIRHRYWQHTAYDTGIMPYTTQVEYRIRLIRRRRMKIEKVTDTWKLGNGWLVGWLSLFYFSIMNRKMCLLNNTMQVPY